MINYLLFLYGYANEKLDSILLIILVLTVLNMIALWKIFDKACEDGWKALIPVYNKFVLYDIAWGSPYYYLLELFAPVFGIIALMVFPNVFGIVLYLFVGSIMQIIFPFVLADAFKKTALFGIGLMLLPQIFYLILAFDKSEYNITKFLSGRELERYNEMQKEFEQKKEDILNR